MSIATKRGDDGTTGTLKGRCLKCDCNIQVIGDIDELNCLIGEVVLQQFGRHANVLHRIQDHLFRIGSDIACDYHESDETLLTKEHLDDIENELTYYESVLPPLKNFILPNNRLHTARAVCRRAERSYIAHCIESTEPRPKIMLKYLNRLSDLLFQIARRIGVSEVVWKP